MFSNKSWYFSLVMVVVTSGLTLLIGLFGYLSFVSIFHTRIYEVGKSGWVVLLSEILIFLLAVWILIVVVAKYFVYNSFIKIDQKGIEVKYLSRWFKPFLYTYKWDEIETVGDRIGKIQYEFFIKIKSKDPKKDEFILLPLELWQSTFRVHQLKKEVENHSTHSDFSKLAKAVLVFGDILIILFLLIFIGLTFYSFISSLVGSCNCF